MIHYQFFVDFFQPTYLSIKLEIFCNKSPARLPECLNFFRRINKRRQACSQRVTISRSNQLRSFIVYYTFGDSGMIC